MLLKRIIKEAFAIINGVIMTEEEALEHDFA